MTCPLATEAKALAATTIIKKRLRIAQSFPRHQKFAKEGPIRLDEPADCQT
jgi:hypothetical protein